MFTGKLYICSITIRLNVNGTVDDDFHVQEEDPAEAPEGKVRFKFCVSNFFATVLYCYVLSCIKCFILFYKMVSRPPFIVEINKGGDTTLSLQCSFPHPDDAVNTNPEDQQQYGKSTQ